MQRIVGLVICITIFLSVSVSGAEVSEWAREDVEAIFSMDLVSDDYFESYQGTITRAEYGYLIYQLYEYLSGRPISETIDLSVKYGFTDTDDLYLTALNASGLANGYSDGSYRPDQAISREEIMTLYVRMLEKLGFELNSGPMTFSDKEAISGWALDSVTKCTAMNIVKGKGDNKVDPLGYATVQESLVVLNRIVSNVNFEPLNEFSFIGGAYIVSDMNKMYALERDILGATVGIDSYRDYDYRDSYITEDVGSPWMAMEDRVLYYIDSEGDLRADDPSILIAERTIDSNSKWYVEAGLLYIEDSNEYEVFDLASGVLVSDTNLPMPYVSSLSIEEGVLSNSEKALYYNVRDFQVIGNHVIVLMLDGFIKGYNLNTAESYDFGQGDIQEIHLSGNYMVLISQIQNDISLIRYVPVFDLRDYLK